MDLYLEPDNVHRLLDRLMENHMDFPVKRSAIQWETLLIL